MKFTLDLKRQFLVVIILGILLLSSTLLVLGQSNGNESEEYVRSIVIYYDVAHGQFFNETYMNETLFDVVTLMESRFNDVNISLVFFNESYNFTNLQGVDLLIISPPAQFGTNNAFTKEEVNAIKQFHEDGGSLLLMGNPYMKNDTIMGNVPNLNNLLEDLDITRLRFPSDTAKPDVIMDDFNHVFLNDSYISLDNNSFIQELFANEPFEINNITLYSSSIRGLESPINEDNRTVAITYNTSYVIKGDGEVGDVFAPAWLAMENNTDKGNMLMIGSTIMFSNLELNVTLDNENKTFTWREMGEHVELLANMASWLVGLTPIAGEESLFKQPYFVYALIIVVLSVLFIVPAIFLLKYTPTGKKVIDISKTLKQIKKKEPSQQKEKGKKTTKTSKKKPRKKKR